MKKSMFATIGLSVALGLMPLAAHAATSAGDEQAQLKKEAKISLEHARKIALGHVKEGTVESSELERENGKLIYSFDIREAARHDVTEVNIDAMNGGLVAISHENAKKEAAEARQEASAAQNTDAAMRKEAKISESEARRVALHHVRKGTVESSELERENGKLIYSFDIHEAGRHDVTEVNVNAIDGKIVAIGHENASKEAAEKKRESKEGH